ncbi:MAG: hypothetical protein JWQ38_3810 [Flavipsychrobacter sp.]|nr:hypothetical protein [Flavipsychrobacter sp.]
MKTISILLFVCCLAVVSTITACHREATKTQVLGDYITAEGVLEQQGFTTYMYGTHVLTVNAQVSYVLESTTINLDNYIGFNVVIKAVNTHYHAEQGPEMYNVTSIQLK